MFVYKCNMGVRTVSLRPDLHQNMGFAARVCAYLSSCNRVVQQASPSRFKSHEFICAVCAGKLKELGNTVLGKFGMSLDNFKADKDPQTGSYSINFKQ